MRPGLAPDWPFLPTDWLSSTNVSGMTLAEQGGYFRLLCHGWSDPDCCLPDDDATLATLSGLGAQWKRSAGKIRACFEPDKTRPGFIFNPRQRRTRKEQAARITKASDQRAAAARARWQR